jgi:hypothetical protein
VTARAGSGVTAYAARRAVQQHFVAKMDKEVTDSLADAMWNLHYGPSGGGRSYETCLTTLRAWSESTLNDAYYDVQSGEVIESEPEGSDGGADDFMHFEASEIRKLLFKDLIAQGGF